MQHGEETSRLHLGGAGGISREAIEMGAGDAETPTVLPELLVCTYKENGRAQYAAFHACADAIATPKKKVSRAQMAGAEACLHTDI